MKQGEELYSFAISNCVFNGFLCYIAIVVNSVTIHAIRRTHLLSRPSKTLLLSLAVSDLGVGSLVQPLYILRLSIELEENTENNVTYNVTSKAFLLTATLFRYASFFGLIALSADRFLAIYLHLRYKEIVTHKRVVVVVIFIWILSAFLSLARLWTSMTIIYLIFAIIEATCLITAALLSYKIFLAVRRHTREIQAQQLAQNVAMANVGRLKKSVVGAVYLYIVFLVCYLPNTCYLFIKVIEPQSGIAMEGLSNYSKTLVLLNSSLNPLIYCWKMRQIRLAVITILRNAFRSHNQLRQT